jgi:hypothetical protein
MKSYPFHMTSDEILICDGLVYLGMSAASIQNDDISPHQSASIIANALAYHENRLNRVRDPSSFDLFKGKFKALCDQRDKEDELGLLDGIPDSGLPVVLRMDWDRDEAILLAAMVSFCAFALHADSDLAGQMAAYMNLGQHARHLGQARVNKMFIRFNNAIKAALPDVDFVAL